VTIDVREREGGGELRQPGGGAFYSALQAARLGLRALIVTQGLASELEPLLEPYREELAVEIVPSAATTTMLTRGAGEERQQRVLAWAGEMRALPAVEAEIVHVATVAHEMPRWSQVGTGLVRGGTAFVGLTPQGMVRGWREHDRELHLVPLAPESLPERWDAAVVGAHEAPSCAALIASARRSGAVVAVTAGAAPTTVHSATGAVRVPAFAAPAAGHEPGADLGAGDVFAAAFFVALREGADPQRAAIIGNAAAAVRMAGAGPGAVGRRAQIEALALRRDPRRAAPGRGARPAPRG